MLGDILVSYEADVSQANEGRPGENSNEDVLGDNANTDRHSCTLYSPIAKGSHSWLQ